MPLIRVGLLVTCLVDQFFPAVGESAVFLLRRLGMEVDFPAAQTCCGQPGYNSGFRVEARKLACRTIEAFEGYDAVVIPSGSCAAMVRHGYEDLLREEARWLARARALAEKTYELAEYLVQLPNRDDLKMHFAARVTYHDSCHALRGLRLHDEPRTLLGTVDGLELVEMERADVCCGFGGLFAVDFAEISVALAESKIGAIERTGAQYVVSSDSSCLMHLAGVLHRRRSAVQTLHLAELLAQGARNHE